MLLEKKMIFVRKEEVGQWLQNQNEHKKKMQ